MDEALVPRFIAQPTRFTPYRQDQLDRDMIAYRFAPPTIQFSCVWTKDKDWKRVFGNNKATDIIPLQATITFQNGRINASPKILLDLDWTHAQAATDQIKANISERIAPRDYGARLSVQPGVASAVSQRDVQGSEVKSIDKSWEIKSLVISKFSELDPAEDYHTINAVQKYFRPSDISSVWVVKLSTEGGLIDKVWSEEQSSAIDPALSEVLSEVRQSPSTNHIMIFKDNGKHSTIQPIELSRGWWAKLINKRVPPQAHAIDTGSGRVVVDSSSYDVRAFGNFIYASFDAAQERNLESAFRQQNPLEHPVEFPYMPASIHEVDSENYFVDPRDLEARLKIGVVHEQHLVNESMEAYEDHAAHVIVVKAMDWFSGQTTSPHMGPRHSYYVLVMSIDQQHNHYAGFVSPPDRTSFLLWPGKQSETTTSDNAFEKPWIGYRFDHPSAALKEMGVEFCIFATKPSNGAPYQGRIHNTMEEAKNYHASEVSNAQARGIRPSFDTMELKPIVDETNEERELDAIGKICDLKSSDLRHIQMPLLYTYERRQPALYDVVHGSEDSDDVFRRKEHKWQTLRDLLSTKLHLIGNSGQRELIDCLRSLPGAITLVTGPAGSGKTMIAAHIAVLLILLGYRVTLQAWEDACVNNLASEFDMACDNFTQWLVDDGDAELAIEAANICALRYNSSILDTDIIPPDGMVPSAYRQVLDELETATIDKEGELEIANGQVKLDYINGQLQAGTLHEAKSINQVQRLLAFPGHMSMGTHLQRLRNGLAPGDDHFGNLFQLYDRASGGELLGLEELQSFKQLMRKAYEAIISKAQVVICTVAHGADDLVTTSGHFDFAFLDKAEKLSVPAGVLSLMHIKQHAFLLGDTNQIGVELTQAYWNAMSRQLSRSILMSFQEKGVHSVMMVKQYRFAPDVFDFINKIFSEGKVANDQITDNDEAESSPLRIACRRFTMSQGLVSPVNKTRTEGSLLMGVNVRAGVTVGQSASAAKVNYAECEAALQAANDLITDPEIQSSDILIMTYYGGNIRILYDLQERFPNTRGVQIKTVDDCQNDLTKISIVILGATNSIQANRLFESHVKLISDLSWKLTPFVLSPERLKVSLSRSTNLVVFVANFGALNRIRNDDTGSKVSGMALKSLGAYLVANFLVIDSEVVDQNPQFGLAEDPGLRAAFENRVVQDQVSRLTELHQWGAIHTLCKKEQAAAKNIPMPEIMGAPEDAFGSFPGFLNQESRERQSNGEPLPNSKEGRAKAKKAAKKARRAQATSSNEENTEQVNEPQQAVLTGSGVLQASGSIVVAGLRRTNQ